MLIMKTSIISLVVAAFLSATLLAGERATLNVQADAKPIEPTRDIPVVSYADVLARATPSVVAVYTSSVIEDRRSGMTVPRGMEELFRQFGFPIPRNYGDAPRGQQQESTGVGSGVIVSTDGYIVTNHHVVTGEQGDPVDEIRVRLADDREFVAELIGSDAKTDVAVLRIEADKPLEAVTIADSELLRVGDVVFAIGNPLEIGLTATKGIVSATGRDSLNILGRGGYENFIQTDASINLGNSGGALIDAWGRLVGINTAIVSRSGGSIGIGFAIPSNMALRIARSLIESGEVPRGMLGLFPENLTPDLASAFGLASTKGALVNQVQNDSPADRAGIRHGDIITKINSVEIESAPQLRLVVSQMEPGAVVQVSLIRAGKEKILPVTLGSLSGRLATTGFSQLDGVRLQALAEVDRSEGSIPSGLAGVFVQEVAADSPYTKELIQGMVIIEVNGNFVATPDAVQAQLRTGVNTLYVWYAGNWRYLVLRLKD